MKASESYLKHLEQTLPRMVTTSDMIRLGLFKSRGVAQYARMHDLGPTYFKLAHRILYPKECVIEWIKAGQNESKKV